MAPHQQPHSTKKSSINDLLCTRFDISRSIHLSSGFCEGKCIHICLSVDAAFVLVAAACCGRYHPHRTFRELQNEPQELLCMKTIVLKACSSASKVIVTALSSFQAARRSSKVRNSEHPAFSRGPIFPHRTNPLKMRKRNRTKNQEYGARRKRRPASCKSRSSPSL